jgi:hypothetical protein
MTGRRNMKGLDPNGRWVCSNCLKPDPRYFGQPPAWFVGRSVKVAFQSAVGIAEHMWVVVVTGVKGDRLVGRLNTDPDFVEDVEYGDEVVLDRTQIEVVEPPLEEVEADYTSPPAPPAALFEERRASEIP